MVAVREGGVSARSIPFSLFSVSSIVHIRSQLCPIKAFGGKICFKQQLCDFIDQTNWQNSLASRMETNLKSRYSSSVSVGRNSTTQPHTGLKFQQPREKNSRAGCGIKLRLKLRLLTAIIILWKSSGFMDALPTWRWHYNLVKKVDTLRSCRMNGGYATHERIHSTIHQVEGIWLSIMRWYPGRSQAMRISRNWSSRWGRALISLGIASGGITWVNVTRIRNSWSYNAPRHATNVQKLNLRKGTVKERVATMSSDRCCRTTVWCYRCLFNRTTWLLGANDCSWRGCVKSLFYSL